MSNTNLTISATPKPNDLVQFADTHRVQLQAGHYRLTAKQRLNTSDGKIPEQLWTSDVQEFYVQSERYTLPPAAIRSVYPPKGALGNFWKTLPHIVLERSTMPWERTSATAAGDPQSAPPWLALLVFHETDSTPFPEITQTEKTHENIGAAGSNPTETVNLISLTRAQAIDLIPPMDELAKLTHIRRRLAEMGTFASKDAAQASIADVLSNPQEHQITAAEELANLDASEAWILTDTGSGEQFEIVQANGETQYQLYHLAHEAASVLAKRLPLPGARNRVHLVSLENLLPLIAGGGDVELISLHHWDFYCETEKNSFKAVAMSLDRDDWHLHNEDATGVGAQFLKEGFAPLQHFFREGSQSVSWYHGPFLPLKGTYSAKTFFSEWESKDRHPRGADELMMYDTKHGMFDASYAAAWELGRSLTLKNTKVALALYRWKRQNAHRLHALRHLADLGYPLANNVGDQGTTDISRVQQWLQELSLLEHIPFNYLAPNEAFLPSESLRFFKVDPYWVQQLRDGAFSIGRVLEGDAALDLVNPLPPPDDEAPPTSYTGFLLRSELVSGWPQLQMTAYETPPLKQDTERLPDHDSVLLPVRKTLLAPQVMLVLFAGDIAAIDFFLPPETLHFGLDSPDAEPDDPAPGESVSDDPGALVIRLRNPADGTAFDDADVLMESLVDQTDKKLDLPALLTQINTKLGQAVGETVTVGSNGFALQLIAGTDLVRFTI